MKKHSAGKSSDRPGKQSRPSRSNRASTASPVVQGTTRPLGSEHDTAWMPSITGAQARPTSRTGLTLSQRGDRHEGEADRIADSVMQPGGSPGVVADGLPRAQALSEPSHVDHPAAAALQARLEHGPDCGSPLPTELREFFEPRLGYDLGKVRIHIGAEAAVTAERLNTRAFAYGRHVVFGRGQYRPESAQGKRLLAHELAHIVQQLGAGPGQAMVQRDPPVGTVETSEGVQEIEGEVISSSGSRVRDRLQLGEARINTQIDEWARENFNHVAASLETAAESFENWYAAHSSSSSSSFVYDVVTAGLGILSAAYPPAGVAAAILGGVLSVARSAGSARDQARRGAQSNAALLVEQALINKARALRNSSANFGSRMKARGGASERVWSNVGVGLTMNDPNMIPLAKEELYVGARMPSLNQDFTEPALSRMILTYMHWERVSSLESSTFFVSSRDIEWAIMSDEQRRRRAEQLARRQLEIGDESLR